ncbi:MAG: hypothetical protein GAK43_02061 [Stenotrophomonas maltophilia]|nr:MAG: hypothetical protein GAK43_02061 [Stenotrophomonas maltophilia]
MPLEQHPLHREFPEHRERIARQIAEAGHFARLASAYEALDKRIYEVEGGREALDDLALNGLKLQRVALKDEIADLLGSA